jgi:hypothetical protein
MTVHQSERFPEIARGAPKGLELGLRNYWYPVLQSEELFQGKPSGFKALPAENFANRLGCDGRSNNRVGSMRTSWIRCIVGAGLAGVAALIAVVAGDAPVQTAARVSVGLWCSIAPPAENMETHRVYCRADRD